MFNKWSVVIAQASFLKKDGWTLTILCRPEQTGNAIKPKTQQPNRLQEALRDVASQGHMRMTCVFVSFSLSLFYWNHFFAESRALFSLQLYLLSLHSPIHECGIIRKYKNQRLTIQVKVINMDDIQTNLSYWSPISQKNDSSIITHICLHIHILSW